MSIKILWQDIFPENVPTYPNMELVRENLLKVASKVVRPDTKVTSGFVDKFCYSVNYPYLEMLNTTQMINKAFKAEQKGFDAVIMGCAYDPGIHEARGLLNIPVVGPMESSMLLAQMLGDKVGIVFPIAKAEPLLEEKLRCRGFEHLLVKNRPVRVCGYWEPLIKALKGDIDPLLATFELVARGFIEDGANVIVIACAFFGLPFTLAGYNEVPGTGVPVIDIGVPALKMAELLVDIRRSVNVSRTTSVTSPYQQPPENMLADARRNFGLE